MDQIWLCELEHLQMYCDRVLHATEETEKAAAIAFAEEREPPNILSIADETATIEINGTLSNRPSIIGRLLGFGATSYRDIQTAIETIVGHERVKTVRLLIDSPGGGLIGLDEVWIALRELGKTKRIIAENRGLMASAAYWIASAAHTIIATSPAVETGSIGVYALFIDWTEADKKMGIKEIRIVSKNAPEKNPDLATAAGLKSFQARLDAIERVFIDRIAAGRGVSVNTVAQTFGRGGVLIAEDPDPSKSSALSVGMIDAVIAGPGKGKKDDRRAEEESEIVAGSPPFKNLPIVDKPWDATAAIKRVRTKTGSTEKPSMSYKNAFFWYDPKNADAFGGYKLPFVDVDGGALKAVRRGVFAAKGAMAGARGGVKIPPADRAAVNSHIDKYVKKIEKEDEKKKSTAAAYGKEVLKMAKLGDLLAEHPDLVAEIEAIKAEVKKVGAEEYEARVKAATPILTGEYPTFLKEKAVALLKGETTAAELAGAVSAYDAIEEKRKADIAAAESEGQGPTPAANPIQGSGDGEIKTEEDFNIQVARFRTNQGQEKK